MYAPCAAGVDGTPFSIDGSLSSDVSGKALASFLWTYTGTGASDLQAAIAAQSSEVSVAVPGSVLSTLPAGDYTVALVVTNFMGIASTAATANITMVQGSYAPSFYIDGPPEQSFVLADAGLELDVQLDPTSICDGLTPSFKWGFAPGSSPTFDLAAVETQSSFALTATQLSQAGAKAGSTYQLLLQGQLLDAAGNASAPTPTQAKVSVTFRRSPLRASVNGPSGWVPSTQAVVFSVSAVDPDSAKGAKFQFSWACSREDGKACFPDPTKKGNQSANGSWSLLAADLASNVAHTFTVTVKATDGSNRVATASRSVTVITVVSRGIPLLRSRHYS